MAGGADRGLREHVLECGASDAKGDTQPLDPLWVNVGFGNNAVCHVHATGKVIDA